MKSLFNICLSTICQHRSMIDWLLMPTECKQQLLEWLCSHDQLNDECNSFLKIMPAFGRHLTRLNFYLSDELSDDILIALAANNHRLQQVTIVDCPHISDDGIVAITDNQPHLARLELRSLRQLTSFALSAVSSPYLTVVDLSGCTAIDSDGIVDLLTANRNIRSLYLNHCLSLDDDALYAIGNMLGASLAVLELDFLSNLRDPSTSLYTLSRRCPNIRQLSLCRYFPTDDELDPMLHDYRIAGAGLRDVDLYGNYFFTLPMLPLTITSIRLSVCGDEDVHDLISRLRSQRFLTSIRLQLSCREEDNRSVADANRFLSILLPIMGSKITRLQLSMPRLDDRPLLLITQCCRQLSHLALDVKHINAHLLQRYFSGGEHSVASQLRSLKLCRLRITYRALFAIARHARSLHDLETAHMPSVDDRFVTMIADNCPQLRTVNFNGCKWVSDKGMSAMARRCPLREVRVRGTGVTDKCVYILAQFCPDLEWIAHADYSGRPKFSDDALQCLRNACVNRVIC